MKHVSNVEVFNETVEISGTYNEESRHGEFDTQSTY